MTSEEEYRIFRAIDAAIDAAKDCREVAIDLLEMVKATKTGLHSDDLEFMYGKRARQDHHRNTGGSR